MLVASLDTRLDELATEISTLEDARIALRTRAPKAQPMAGGHSDATPKRRGRLTPPTKPPARKPSPPAADSEPELAAMPTTGSTSDAAADRRRPAARRASRRRGASLSAEQLEQLLADVGSGLSAGAIAEQAGVGYSRVLAQLRELELAGKVRRTGRRRSTRWLVITDEERIAQRTAELERLVGVRRHDLTQRRGRARAS